ncbi:unnamed protein product [Spodoptera exigua]|nr:unnamed protein product [Spodoptera exigua]
MSFITKRERVFNEYDLFDLPARNEGKLKAYASCTDARAWSHFCSDKSEHLVEAIKRNNETVRPKYVPTNVIVDTLMVAKNAEIARLKRKIEEFEQLLAAYDQLDLTCDQKCDIAHAHAAIRAANKELDDLTTGKDILCLDIKGKILFKLLVLEKFCVALIAPCTRDFVDECDNKIDDCACYRVDVLSRVKPTFAVTASDSESPNLDSKRAQLVADIIQNDEMKEILSKDTIKTDEDLIDNVRIIDDYNIERENLKRLKTLQENFDDLMSCYEKLKLDKALLEKRCERYEEIEREFESLKMQMREYDSLWNEKEHYRRRSVDLDSLKEQYLILSDETSDLETQLKAQSEINHIKRREMDSLRNENISLEKKLNEASIAFEKEKNVLLCKLKEAECRVMCQEQQIKTLSLQIDKILEQDHTKPLPRDSENHTLSLMDELQSCKEQVKNLRDALFCNEEEKQELQKHYQDQMELINKLKLEIEDWKSTYERTMQRNEYLEEYKESLLEETRLLKENLHENTSAVDNLMSVIKNKSQEINKLMQEMERKKDENRDLLGQLNDLRERFSSSLDRMEKEKLQALQSLQVTRQESKELLDKIKDYDETIHKKEDATKSLELQLQENKEVQNMLIEKNRNLEKELTTRDNNNSLLLQEIQRLRELNQYAVNNINSLENENNQYQISLDLTQKESGELKNKMMYYENLSNQLQNLQESYDKLFTEKSQLENQLLESDELINSLQQSEESKANELSRLTEQLTAEKYAADEEIIEKKRHIENLLQNLDTLTLEKEHLLRRCKDADDLERELENLKVTYVELSHERSMLQNDFDNKTEEFNHLYNTLENKIEENRELIEQIKTLEANQAIILSDVKSAQDRFHVMEKKSDDLVNRLKFFENLEKEFQEMKKAHDDLKMERDNLEFKLKIQLDDLKIMQEENENLQNALIGTRTETDDLMVSNQRRPWTLIIPKKLQQVRCRPVVGHKGFEHGGWGGGPENTISSLSEDVYERDSKIATLQNHLNELEEEITRLHASLDEVIDTGEQIKDFSFQKLDSMKNMEAHHSRATHNMKRELAKLQNENSLLSEQLSVTRVQYDEFSRDNFKIASQLKHLQNEREIIVTDIKQLELKTVGESALAPNKCDVEDILASLDRIRKSIDARFLKVQTSSQLLLSKADEAKKIVEREKQKIINEKEEAIISRQNMEKQLLELKTKLENQIADDKIVMMNQKLISDRKIKSSQDYISKLKEELDALQSLYKNSVEKISEQQEKLQNMTKDKDKLLEMVEEIKADLRKKSNEVAELQNQLDALMKKTHRNMETQTHEELSLAVNGTETSSGTKNKLDFMDNISLIETNKPHVDKDHTQLEMQVARPHLGNEVQVLAAAVEQPPFELIKSSYIDYKMKRLKLGNLEKQSITCFIDSDKEKTEQGKNNNFIDIYNRQSMHTNSSKGNDGSDNIIRSKIASHSLDKSTGYTTHESYGSESNAASKLRDSKINVVSTSENSTDKDLFVIYKDSESSYNNNNKAQSKGTWSGKGHSEIVVEAVTVLPKNNTNNIDPNNYGEKNSYIFQENEESIEDDSVRQKLEINLPRVGTESPSDIDKKSLDSYTLALYPSAKRLSDSDTKVNGEGKTVKHDTSLPKISNDDQFMGSYISLGAGSEEDAIKPGKRKTKASETGSRSKQKHSQNSKKRPSSSTPFDSESHHKLSRIGADVLLLKAEQDQKSSQAGRKDFGLEYIMDTVLGEVDPNAIKYYATKDLRKTRSDERFNLIKIREKTDSSPSRLNINVSDTIRNIFEQVDIEQRKMAEHTYLKYIANKILSGSIDGPFKLDGLQALDTQELSFLHLKVCRMWKTKLNKEEDFKKRIDSLESELISKQRNTQQHIAELDRKVAEERRRLQEVREAVCRSSPIDARTCSPEVTFHYAPPPNPEKESCGGCTQRASIEAGGRRSAGDLAPELTNSLKPRRIRPENNKRARRASAHAAHEEEPLCGSKLVELFSIIHVTPTRADVDERRERKLYHDEPPTRLRRSHDRQGQRSSKK